MTTNDPKYPIGTQFTTRGKRRDICTVSDIYRTYNNKNQLVRVSYAATHEFCGQTITNHDVCAATIALGLRKEITP